MEPYNSDSLAQHPLTGNPIPRFHEREHVAVSLTVGKSDVKTSLTILYRLKWSILLSSVLWYSNQGCKYYGMNWICGGTFFAT